MLFLQVCQRQGNTLQWRLVFSAAERIGRLDKRSCGNSNQSLPVLFKNGSVSSRVVQSLVRHKRSVQMKHSFGSLKWINKKGRNLSHHHYFTPKHVYCHHRDDRAPSSAARKAVNTHRQVSTNKSKESHSCIHFTERTNAERKGSSKRHRLWRIRLLPLPYRIADAHRACTKLPLHSHIKSNQCRIQTSHNCADDSPVLALLPGCSAPEDTEPLLKNVKGLLEFPI